MQKKWNVMIVPSSPGNRVYNFDLTSRSLRIAAIAGAALLVLVIVSAIYTIHDWKQKKLTQISHLESEINARDAELSQLNREFGLLEELEDKLRTIAGLKPRERSNIDATAGGQGGPGMEPYENGFIADPLSGGPETLGGEVTIDHSVQELLEGSLELKDSFAEIMDVFERESTRLLSVPSVNPVASQEAWVSSGFGYREDPISGKRRFHEGTDIVAPRGTPVIAPADGVVTYAGWRDGMGRTVDIEHGYGYTTAYGHNDKLLVKKGDLVKRGDIIAYIGSSGRSTGPHLHYEVRLHGKLVNPWKYLVR